MVLFKTKGGGVGAGAIKNKFQLISIKIAIKNSKFWRGNTNIVYCEKLIRIEG